MAEMEDKYKKLSDSERILLMQIKLGNRNGGHLIPNQHKLPNLICGM